jgi:hypothetical protein
MVLKAILNQFEPASKEALLRFVSSFEKEEIERSPNLEGSLTLESFSVDSVLDKVHWSWFLPTLKLYPEAEQKLFLSTLSGRAEKNLAKVLTLSIRGEGVTLVGKDYLRKTLLDSLNGSKILPVHHLPKSKLEKLLSFSKKELTQLIDRLSLYDLSMELRQIVETKILKKIYSLLTEEEKNFLKAIGAHKDPFAMGRLGIEKWDGSEESLRTLLHKRGLARLGAGLSGQDPDFIWYICHGLDIGRGSVLYKLCLDEPLPGVTEVIMTQIEENL